MKTSKNRLTLDFKDLPDLKAALGGLAPGDRCRVSFDLMVVSNDDEQIESDIEEIEYDIPGDDGESEKGEVETSSDEPVMAVIAKRSDSSKKKKAVPAAEPAAAEDDE